MIHRRALTILIIGLLLAGLPLTLAGCNFPLENAEPADPLSAGDVSGGGAPATAAPAATPSPAPTATPPPTPDIPPEWALFDAEAYGLTLSVPPGWAALPRDAHTIDVREEGGPGWAEVAVLDEETDLLWGLTYTPGTDAAAILADLLAGLREDGQFGEPFAVIGWQGVARATDGYYEVYAEELLVGVSAGPDRAVIVTGHGVGDAAVWGSYRAVYETLLASVAGR
ncbi:MAG: hypothetical protein Kow00124_11190 [Anaerolineae bacterium]